MGDIGSAEIFSKTPRPPRPEGSSLTAPLAPDTIRVGSSSHAPRHQRISTQKGFFHIQGRPDTLPYGASTFQMDPSSTAVIKQPLDAVSDKNQEDIKARVDEIQGPNQFVPWLKKMMVERGKSQRALAELSGVDHTTILRLLANTGREPRMSIVASVVGFFAKNAGEDYDREVYDMIVSHAPDEIKRERGKGVFPVDKTVLTGTPREQLDGYISLSKISNIALASRIGIDKSFISKLRTSDRLLPKLEVFARLVVGLELTPEQVKGYLKAIVYGKTEPEDSSVTTQTPEVLKTIQDAEIPSPDTASSTQNKTERVAYKESEPIWINSESLTPEVLGQIFSIYAGIFGKNPRGKQDLTDPEILQKNHSELMRELFEGQGFAEWGMLDIRRLQNEKGKFIRFKSKKYDPNDIAPELKSKIKRYVRSSKNIAVSQEPYKVGRQYAKRLLQEFQDRIGRYIVSRGLGVENSKAVGRAMNAIEADSDQLAA